MLNRRVRELDRVRGPARSPRAAGASWEPARGRRSGRAPARSSAGTSCAGAEGRTRNPLFRPGGGRENDRGGAGPLKEEDRLYTFTVLTTFPNEASGTVHGRTPAIVQAKDYQRWLDPENEDVAEILATPPSDGWIAYPVSRRVNSPKNDDAKLIEPEPA
jgi:hypothetical protein